MNIIGVIYKYTSLDGKVYIGQTLHEEQRKKDFLQVNKNYAGAKINNARKKYGPNSFSYEILEQKEYKTIEDANNDLNSLEEFYIKKFDSIDNGYNISTGGVSVRNVMLDYNTKNRMIESLKKYYKTHIGTFKGRHHTEESRKKLREAARQRVKNGILPFKGRHHTEESRKKASERMKKKVGTLNYFYGKHHSTESKHKISEANGKKVVQIDKATNEILNYFNSATEAAIFIGKSKKANGTILDACNENARKGHRKVHTAYGYKWRLKQDVEGSTTIGTDGKEYYLPSTSTSQANGDGSEGHSNKE